MSSWGSGGPHASRRSIGAGGGTASHAERMARGRQQRLERSAVQGAEGLGQPEHQLVLRTDSMEESPFEHWQRQTAAHMLKDLERSGVDEDLEALQAGWASGFTASAYRRAHSFGADFFQEQVSTTRPSELNRRGDMAMRRLHAVQHLRQVGQEDSSPQRARGAASRPQGTIGPCGMQALPASCASPLMLGGPSSSSGTQRWRGPLDNSDSGSEDEDEHQVLALQFAGPQRQRPSPVSRRATWQVSQRGKHAAQEEDPWFAWESRWEEAFRKMDSVARAREQAERMREEEEARERWAEAERIRQEEVFRQQARKAEAERRRARASTGGQAGGASGRASSSGQSSGWQSGWQSGQSFPKAPPPTGAPPPRRPPPAAQTPSAGPPGAPPVPRFENFSAFEDAWGKFEAKARSDGTINYADVPWPLSLPTVSGVTSSDSAAERKKKLRSALLRWHPDKWAPLLDRIKNADKEFVMQQVKEVTRKIIAEKEQYGS